MISVSILVSLALVPFTIAQSSDVGVQIEGIEANFQQAQIVPSLLATFEPTSLLSVNFAGAGAISTGAPLTQAQVSTIPTLTLTPGNSSVTYSGSYTLAMVDAGPVGTDESQGQTRHMLINGVTVSGTTVSTQAGTAVTAYAGPAPPPGTGPHRYVILLYTQPASFTPPANLSSAGVPVSVYNFPDYVQSTGLGPLVAANYFTVENGTATASIAATSAVVSSTLSVAASGTTAASASSAPTGTGSSTSDATTAKVSAVVFILAPLMALLL